MKKVEEIIFKISKRKHDSGFRCLNIIEDNKEIECGFDIININIGGGDTLRIDSNKGEVRIYSSTVKMLVPEDKNGDTYFVKIEKE